MKKIYPDDKLASEIAALRGQIAKFDRKWSRSMQTRWLLSLSFLKGVVSAMGALAAVVIITPLIIWSLQKVSWPPLIQRVVSQIILQIGQANRQLPQGVGGQ
jgi:hypothetical protein